MPINTLDLASPHLFGFSVEGKLTADDVKSILPELEKAIKLANKKLRLLVQLTDMENAKLKSELEVFSFLKHHVGEIELIAIVGAHSWSKVMCEALSSSIFVLADSHYFKSNELEGALEWLRTAAHPSHIPVRKVIDSPDGLFTKYASADFM
jgi:hypothetical protein